MSSTKSSLAPLHLFIIVYSTICCVHVTTGSIDWLFILLFIFVVFYVSCLWDFVVVVALFVFVLCLVYPLFPRPVSCVPTVPSFSGLSILDFALRGSLTFTEACVNVRNDVDQSQLISDDLYQYFACKFHATTIPHPNEFIFLKQLYNSVNMPGERQMILYTSLK
jgi:hypothetical protein